MISAEESLIEQNDHNLIRKTAVQRTSEKDKTRQCSLNMRKEVLTEKVSSSNQNQTFVLPYSENDEISLNQQSMGQQNSSTIGSHHRPVQTLTCDWAQSSLMKDVLSKKVKFNSIGDPRFFREEELDYIIEMFQKNEKEFRRANMIEPFHRKAFDTLAAIMRDLNLLNQCVRIQQLHKEVSPSNAFKLMEKCSSMLQARSLIFQVLKDLDKHDQLVKDIRDIVDLNLAESVDPAIIEQIRTLALKLPNLTRSIKDNILYLRDEFKLFARIQAMSSKSKTVVSNVFIFKKKDALKFILQEYEDIRNLVTIFDIKDLPFLGIQPKRKNSNAQDTLQQNSKQNNNHGCSVLYQSFNGMEQSLIEENSQNVQK